MHVTIARADLARILSGTIKAVEARNTIPILSNILLSAVDGKLTVTATDLDVQVTASTAANIDELGEATVNAALLSGIVGKIPANAEILLFMEDGDLIVKSVRSRFKLRSLPVGDFPHMTAGEFAVEFTFDIAAFTAPVAFAISNEETRYYLNGVYLHNDRGCLAAAATDGHRLARNYSEFSVPDFAGIIIPAKTVTLLPKGENTVRVSENKIQIDAGDFIVTSKLIDGTYPDYQRVIPTGNDKKIVADNAAFTAAADRVAIIGERGRAVKLHFDSGIVAMSVTSADNDIATDEVAVDYSGAGLDIGFNSKYLAEITRALPPGNFNIALADGMSPALFTSGSAPNLTLVLMPMRV